MKTEEQIVAIAEACGKQVIFWKVKYNNHGEIKFQVFKTEEEAINWPFNKSPFKEFGPESFIDYSKIPDYLNSLDAMHEAEKILTREQIQSYKNRLAEVCPERIGSIYGFWPCIHATAAQRAEAFLKAIGKWKD